MSSKLFGRKSAEIISFAVSSAIILGLFVYLGFDYVRSDDSEFLDITITVQREKIQRVGDHYLVPVKLKNNGFKTPALTIFSVHTEEGERIIEVSYLSKQSSKIVYIAYKNDPSGKDLKVQLQNYQL